MDQKGWVVVPTNTTIRKDGQAVMGKGLAAAAQYWGWDLAKQLAIHIRRFNDRLYVCHGGVLAGLICLPTKHDWRRRSELEYVEKGCRELVEVADLLGDSQPIFLPKLGCGLGGLDWEMQVRPVVDSLLEGDRFVLVQHDE